ncbi:hypothetical protein BP00DRAFT_55081 [Aspergillus indologenus CBS 114.80]|uniref:Uncharacterized protein n=1 Tax=Aspergillus indologenus CBS 114.80 TaxID=1450541 RepID=A0A2V5ICK6_9EURO|nr:hypothetical protein BP00DRAFT_55081 [Aspergillus indologenus CBS 114.80]
MSQLFTRTWEDYLEEQERWEEDRSTGHNERSFVADARSYDLANGRILNAVLIDENGRSYVSELDLGKCFEVDLEELRYGRLPLDWTAHGKFFDQVEVTGSPFIHSNREWGPMLCVSYSYFEPWQKYRSGPHSYRLNLGRHVTVQNGQLTFTYGDCSGVPQPPIREPWRQYFTDIDEAREVASYTARECLGDPGDGNDVVIVNDYSVRMEWKEFCAAFVSRAVAMKYGGHSDHELNEHNIEDHRGCPLVMWLQSELEAGNVPGLKLE